MRKWLWRAGGGAVALLAALLCAAALFLAKPGLFLTSRTAGAAVKFIGASYSPRWSRLSFIAEALELRRHRYAVSASDFCLQDPAGVFSACFSEFELSVVLFYSRRGPVLERVERLVAVSDGARLNLARRPAPGARAVPLAALRTTTLLAARVKLSRFEVAFAKGAVAGDFSVELEAGTRRPLSAALDAVVRTPALARRLRADLSADTDMFKGGPPSFVNLSVRADLAPHGSARGAFRVRREGVRLVAAGAATVSPSTGPVRALRLTSCEGSAAPKTGAALSCRYELTPASGLGPLKTATGVVSVAAVVSRRIYTAAAWANFDPVGSWYELSGDIVVRARGRLDRPLKDATVNHEVRAAAKVPRFEDLVAFLRGRKYAIPAPFHTLAGPLTLSVLSRGDSRSPGQTARYAFTSDLTGARQRLVLRASGDLEIEQPFLSERAFVHTGVLILKEVALELPRLDVGRTPKVLVDGRITAGVAPEVAVASAPAGTSFAGPPRARGRIAVKTEKPLILFSNHAKQPVPVILDLIATFPPLAASGVVAAQKFDLELFRRTATVDHLNVIYSSGSKIGALEGLVRYKTPGVDISIEVLGTVEKPRIELTSVPPMKREDILAALIFGKNPEELDPEQTASVGNIEKALESRAFGLASLYLFGATPIEHVGYDSATKTTSVKLRLPHGANLTLGGDFDQNRQLSVRKQLAPHWAIESEVSDQGRENRAAATFLEWFLRY